MSLKYWLNKTVTVQRCTRTKDAVGGWTEVWASLSGAVSISAALIPKKRQAPDKSLNREDWHGEWIWILDGDYGIKPGDRIAYGTTYYYATAVIPYEHDSISNDTPYAVECELRKVS